MPFDVANKRWVCDSCGTPTIRTATGWTCPNNMVCGARIVTGFKSAREVDVGDHSHVGDESDGDVSPCQRCKGSGKVDCDECDGFGDVVCNYGHDHDCEECDGEGEIPCPLCSVKS